MFDPPLELIVVDVVVVVAVEIVVLDATGAGGVLIVVVVLDADFDDEVDDCDDGRDCAGFTGPDCGCGVAVRAKTRRKMIKDFYTYTQKTLSKHICLHLTIDVNGSAPPPPSPPTPAASDDPLSPADSSGGSAAAFTSSRFFAINSLNSDSGNTKSRWSCGKGNGSIESSISRLYMVARCAQTTSG